MAAGDGQDGRVVAIGGANVDWACRVHEPARLGTSNPGFIRTAFGGVARNIACNLARLGVPVSLISAVGDDAAGAGLRADCEGWGVDCASMLTVEGTTSTYVATLDADGELVVAVAAMDIVERLTPSEMTGRAPILGAASLIFADANLSPQTLAAIAAIAAQNRVPLVLDPVSTRKAVRLRAVLDARSPVFLVTPNRDELAVLADADTTTPDDIAMAAGILHTRGVACVVVGLGAAGAFVSSAAGSALIAAVPAKVEDVTGAGDAAIAAIIWALRAGHDLIAAAKAAQAASALTIASFGAMSPLISAAALQTHMERRR